MMSARSFCKLSSSILRSSQIIRHVNLYSNFVGSQSKRTTTLFDLTLNNKRLGNIAIRTCTQHRDNKNEEEPHIYSVYNGSLASQIRYVKIFSLTTSATGIALQPVLYNQLSETNSVPVLIAGLTFFGFFTFITPFLLHFITKKYVINVDYNSTKETYIAKTLNIFCMSKEIEFTPEDVHVPDVPGMFTTFLAKGKPLFLEAKMFDNPAHYARIMGYDKPMDFKLYQTDDSEEKKKA